MKARKSVIVRLASKPPPSPSATLLVPTVEPPGAAIRSKYRNKKTVVDGITFDSKREAARYCELKKRLATGAIRDLRLQPPYPFEVRGVKLGKYVGDFLYYDVASQRDVLEDVKGIKTAVYRLKKKLMLALYGIEIVEV